MYSNTLSLKYGKLITPSTLNSSPLLLKHNRLKGKQQTQVLSARNSTLARLDVADDEELERPVVRVPLVVGDFEVFRRFCEDLAVVDVDVGADLGVF